MTFTVGNYKILYKNWIKKAIKKPSTNEIFFDSNIFILLNQSIFLLRKTRINYIYPSILYESKNQIKDFNNLEN